MERVKRNSGDELIPLDNSAIIYPPTVARYNTHTFRIGARLTIDVDPQRLLRAGEAVLRRYPHFAVSLHQGFYWYYFLPNKRPLEIYKDESYPCGYLHRKKGANGYLFKILYRERSIAVEYFHVLTDGTVALSFLKSLLAQYFGLSRPEVEGDPHILHPQDEFRPEEGEDSFERFYTPRKALFASQSEAFHLGGRSPYTDRVQSIAARIAVEELKTLSSQHQVTITEYLVALLLEALQAIQEEQVAKERRYRPVRVSVPVNVRRIFDSKTVRNFSLFTVVGIDPRLGHYEFEEILEQVKYQLRGSVNEKHLSLQIARNVVGRRLPFIRYAPNVLKKPFMKLLSDFYGDKIYSMTLSNIGYITLPEKLKGRVERLDFFLSPNKKNKVSAAAIGVNGYISLNFTSFLTDDTTFERKVLRALVERGVAVEIATNRRIEGE